jgi:hypothetical protein
MAKNPKQPREDDAVIGGQAPPPSSSAILGGIEGVRQRASSAIEEQRLAALFEALSPAFYALATIIL